MDLSLGAYSSIQSSLYIAALPGMNLNEPRGILLLRTGNSYGSAGPANFDLPIQISTHEAFPSTGPVTFGEIDGNGM